MIKKYFIAGLVVWVPLWVTLLVLGFLIDIFDRILGFLPTKWQPYNLLGVHIPGLGLLLTVILVFVTGLLVTNFLGKKLVRLWERVLARIPLVRSIYNAVKQVVHTIFSSNGESFRKVLLIQYPREGLWSIAFQTSTGFKEGEKHIGEDTVTVFVPTTPNPTSGFLLIVPAKDVVELDITVDAALRMVISLGVVLPGTQEEKTAELKVSS